MVLFNPKLFYIMIRTEFIPYTEALAMKELGFDETCFFVFDSPTTFIPECEAGSNSTNVDAPLYQQAFRWFREKHKSHVEMHCGIKGKHWVAWLIVDWDKYHKGSGNFDYFDNNIAVNNNYNGYDTYEEAQLACLQQLIKITQNDI